MRQVEKWRSVDPKGIIHHYHDFLCYSVHRLLLFFSLSISLYYCCTCEEDGKGFQLVILPFPTCFCRVYPMENGLFCKGVKGILLISLWQRLKFAVESGRVVKFKRTSQEITTIWSPSQSPFDLSVGFCDPDRWKGHGI